VSNYKYQIVVTSQYKKAFKQIIKRGVNDLDELKLVIDTLAQGKELDEKYLDHSIGMQRKYGKYPVRECHVENDFLLVYRKAESVLELILIDLGSHSDIFR